MSSEARLRPAQPLAHSNLNTHIDADPVADTHAHVHADPNTNSYADSDPAATPAGPAVRGDVVLEHADRRQPGDRC